MVLTQCLENMAPTISCSFLNQSTKKNYGADQDIYGAILIAKTIRDQRKNKFISPSNKHVIITRLRKNMSKSLCFGENPRDPYIYFKESCPPISSALDLPLIEFTYQIGINIWYQQGAKDVPVLIRGSTLPPHVDELNLVSKVFSDINKTLRYLQNPF